MQARTVERVESWDSRPYTGGAGQLHELADADFSGAVSAGGTWLFLLNGRVIGVFEGAVEDVADAEGTVYEAPHESVALLYAMQQRGGETQAKYYTNDTPLSEASETLSDAKFTGYIELSENVLSGDYYVVYYGGRSMSAAFVGTSDELVTGDAAFERADDEVGVYEVVKTPVTVTELPPREDEDSTEAASTEAATGAAAGTDTSTDPDADAEESQSDTQEGDVSPQTEAGAGAGPDSGPESPASESAAASPTSGSASQPESTEGGPDTTGSDSGGRARRQRQAAANRDEAAPEDGSKGASAGTDQAFDDEREWRETTSVPTIDPDDSEGGGDTTGTQARAASGGRRQSSSSTGSSSGRNGRSRSASSSSSASAGPKSTVEKLKQAVKQREQKLQAASERIDALETERDSLESERDDLQSERDDLEARVEQLESERDELSATVADLESTVAAADSGNQSGTDLNAVDALSGTNLFVRYDSKGKPTLDELSDATDRSAVNENLRIDHHTQFDAESATVDGEPFASFLSGTTVYRFVSWAVRALPYEVRDAGHQSGLADLYDALPQVDRAELNGTVEVAPDEDTTVSRTFDVVLRDRMGNPLVVADVSTGRDPVTGDQMAALVEDATAIREGSDDLAAAMYVTGSFFQPAALETAEDETAAGGLFSRADRESFVKVGRKAGYHLCLVEDRNDAFHLTVPEL